MALSDVWYGDGIARLSLVRQWHSNVERRGATVLCCQMKHGIGSVKRSDVKLWYGTVWHRVALRRQCIVGSSCAEVKQCVVVLGYSMALIVQLWFGHVLFYLV